VKIAPLVARLIDPEVVAKLRGVAVEEQDKDVDPRAPETQGLGPSSDHARPEDDVVNEMIA
jgi:hypothetical protein